MAIITNNKPTIAEFEGTRKPTVSEFESSPFMPGTVSFDIPEEPEQLRVWKPGLKEKVGNVISDMAQRSPFVQPGKRLGQLGLHHLSEAVSGLGLYIPDILASKITQEDTLASAVDKITGFEPTPRDVGAGEATKFITSLHTVGRIIGPGIAKIPAREVLRLPLGGGIQFGTRGIIEETSEYITTDKSIDWEKVHAEAGFGTIFGIAEATLGKIAGRLEYKRFIKAHPAYKIMPRRHFIKMREAMRAAKGGMGRNQWRKLYGKDVQGFLDTYKKIHYPIRPELKGEKPPTKAIPAPEQAIQPQKLKVRAKPPKVAEYEAKPPTITKPEAVEVAPEAPKIVYHGTTRTFKDFQDKGIGVHFGTKETATARLKDISEYKEDYKIIPAQIDLKNPLRTKDFRFWNDELVVAKGLKKQGIFNQEDVQEIGSAQPTGRKPWKIIKDKLKAMGYDGIVYKNTIEGKGADSFIVFDKSQITRTVAQPVAKAEPTKVPVKVKTGKIDLSPEIFKEEEFKWNKKSVVEAMVKGYKEGNETLLARPISVVPDGKGGVDIIEGSHRAEAAKIAGVKPPIVIFASKVELEEMNAPEVDALAKKIYEAKPKALAEALKEPAKVVRKPIIKHPELVGVEKARKLVRVAKEKLKAEQVKPKGVPSKIGFPKGEVEAELPTEAIGREPISARQIIESLSKSLKVPYASMATHRPRMAAGWYEVKPVGIRQINVRDLGTAAHEAGHHVDHFWKIRRAGTSKIGRRTWKMPEGTAKGTAAELTKLGKMLYGDRKPPGGYRSEGVAEFIRGYLTGHLDIKKEAPKFYKWFISDYLPNNPEIAIGLNNARAMLTDYRLQGAEARIESQISTKEIRESLRYKAKGANLWMQQMFIDEFAPLRAALEENRLRVAGIEGIKQPLVPTEDPYELAVYFNQKEGARARQMVLHGTIDLWGNKTGKGLKEIMKPIADENAVRPFTHFVVAARSLDLLKRGINPGITKADAQHVYDLYKDNEGWKETAREITDWNGRVLDYLVQAGALESSVAKRMRELNPVYVPFLRAFAKGEKRFGGGGAGKGLITTKKGVFSIKGSGREIIDPFESMIIQTRRMLSIAHKSVIARALANLEAKHRGLAGLIWRVPAPKKATTFRAEQAVKQLQKMGVDVTGVEEDALMTVYGNSPIYLGKDNIIAIVQDGKKLWYEVSPEMYRLLQGLDKFYLPRFLDITFGKAGRAVRLGATGINASFGLVRNPIRDSLDTIFKGTHARGPLASVQGVAKDLSRMGLAKSLGIDPSKAAEEFVAMGGQISGFVGQDRKSLQHLKGAMLSSSVGRYAIHTVGHPIDALRQVFGVAESGPRIQEYEKALIVGEKKYGKGSPSARIYAFNKAQDQTINYSRHGVIGKWLNQMIPFWNANAQDPSKVYRTFRSRGKEATAYAVAFLTLPALGLWWYNKDEEWYKELPAYETTNYLHAKVPGKDVILRIPVPFLVGHIFQSTPVAIIDALYRADPKRVKEHFGVVLEGDVYPLAEWPAIVSPIIDVLQNKDWAGRPIVPKSIEGKLPSDQYKQYTTEFCKTIGRIFKQSPAKIEYLINAWSGGLYRRTGRIAGIITKAPEERQPADWPVIGAIIVRDPYAPKRTIERFYNEIEQLNRAYQSDKITGPEYLERIKLSKAQRALTPLWDELRGSKEVGKRKSIYNKIGNVIKEAQKPMTNEELQKEYDAHTLSVPYKRRGEPFRQIGAPKKGSERRIEELKAEAKKRGIELKRSPRRPPRR